MSRTGYTSPLFCFYQNIDLYYVIFHKNKSSWKKLSLQCPICYEKITEPIRLQCKHLLCQKCFEMLVDLTTLSQRKCPKCRRWIKEIREIFCFGYTLGVLALLFYLCRTVAIDTGHFFHTSLAQCLIFLRHTLMSRIQNLGFF